MVEINLSKIFLMLRHLITLILEAIAKCWSQAPALLYGLAILLGCMTALHWNVILLLPLTCLYSPLFLKSKRRCSGTIIRLLLASIIAIMAVVYIKTTIQFPEIPEGKEIIGTATFEINQLAMATQHLGKFANYKGRISTFYVNGKLVAKNIPTNIKLSDRCILPLANRAYQIEGNLSAISPHTFILRPNRDLPWMPLSWTWSSAAFRQRLKQSVSNYIHEHVKDKRSADFLSGIATGEFEDRMISQELGRFGLQHIMAISGFHFAIVAVMLGLFLRLIFGKRTSIIMLIGFITLYFIFLGCGPSILRAWITCMIALCSFLLERKSMALNTLGLALLGILGFDPLLSENMGFQFSFACTGAILLLFQPCDDLMKKVFYVRPLTISSKMSLFNQHLYCVLCFCREAFALGIAVNLVALPMTLFYFHKFPWMGLAYNLFFPFMVSIAMLLLMLGMLTAFIPPLSDMIHSFNNNFTAFMLNYAYQLPTNFDFLWRSDSFSIELIILQLCIFFIAGIYYKTYAENSRVEHVNNYEWKLI